MKLVGITVMHTHGDAMDSRKVRDSWRLLPSNNGVIVRSGAVRIQGTFESAAQEIETSLRRRLVHG